jgi:hypothetical protein
MGIEEDVQSKGIENNNKICPWPEMVAHACNPSFSVDRDWEDHGSRPAQAKGS